MAHSVSLSFLPKLLLQHDASPDSVLEDVQSAFVAAAQQRRVHTSVRPCGDGLAVALGQRLVVLHSLTFCSAGSSGGGDSRHSSIAGAGSGPTIEFLSAVDAPETITALCWLAGSGQSADECLLVGTSDGHLQLHSATSGALLLRQQLHHSAAVAAAVRWGGSGTDAEDLSEDATITFADAIVRLPAWEVWAAVRWHAGQAGRSSASHWWSAASAAATAATAGGAVHHLAFSKFTLPRGTGPRTAALCLGSPPPSLYAAMTGRREGQHRVHILTVGSAPPVAAFEAEESRAPGLLSLVSDLASSTAASLLGKARSYVPSPAATAGRSLLGGLRRQRSGGSGSVASSASSSMADLQAAGAAGAGGQQQGRRRGDKIPGEPASLAAAVWDEKRSVGQLAPSPCGRWAACCDSLGRVLLVDATSTLVLRMLKGYRDAQVAWLICPEGCSATGTGGAQGGWAALRLHGGSSSSLGGSSAAGSLSVRGSAADLAALQPQLDWEEGWGLDDASERQSDEMDAGQQGEAADKELGQRQQALPPSPLRAGAAGDGSDRQHPSPAQRSPVQQRSEPEAPRPAVLPRSPLLVIYAPRRAVVELWEPHSLSRLGAVACSTQLGLLLAKPVRRHFGAGCNTPSASPPPNCCMLLDALTLTLTDLTEVLLSSAV